MDVQNKMDITVQTGSVHFIIQSGKFRLYILSGCTKGKNENEKAKKV